MFKNYLKIAIRNLRKNKVYSTLNISGLAVGMAATILIGLWVADELTQNNYFKKKERIAQILQHQTVNGVTYTNNAIPRPLEFALRNKYNDNFKHIVMSSWTQPRYLEFQKKTINFRGNFMQEGAIDMLNLEIIKGEKNGLKEKNSIMLSETTAKALFGNEDAVGKIIKDNGTSNLKVTSIYKDIPESNTFSELKFIMPWKYYITTQDWIKSSVKNWGNNSFGLFVEINKNTDMNTISEKIAKVKQEGDPELIEYNPILFLHPMKDWHLKSKFENGVNVGGRIENVWLFGIIGTFILILACINFVNLSTARSEKRALEVGIRKSIGSKREQLIFQFLSETFILVLISFSFAIGIVMLSLDGFNNIAQKVITFPWTSSYFWSISFLFIFVTSILAGSYPAIYLSSFNPVSVLKGTFKSGKNSNLPRKVLVVTQFTISVALIIGTLVVSNQIEFSKNRPTGYDKEQLVQLPVMSADFKGKAELMRNQFKASGAVVEMATTSSPTTQIWSNRSGYTWEGKPEGFQEDLAYTEVSYEFVETLGVKVLLGRGFSREFPSDSTAVIINKTAMEYMGLKDPIGKYIKNIYEDNERTNLKIVGVIDDIVTESPYEPVKQAMYVFQINEGAYYNLRLNSKNSVRENLDIIENIFTHNFPNLPFEYQFIDDEYDIKFRAEERISSLARIFTFLAIFISCLGIFGLASFVAEQRTKEIGVRKVLGASVSQLWVLLSKDFLFLVVLALLLASPVAYYIMSQWLLKFSYRTDVGWEVIALAGFGALFITLVTVSFQAIKAAISNPTTSLRSE